MDAKKLPAKGGGHVLGISNHSSGTPLPDYKGHRPFVVAPVFILGPAKKRARSRSEEGGVLGEAQGTPSPMDKSYAS